MGEHEWEAEAQHWVRWAQTPNHDAYWFYRDAFFDGLVPPAGQRTLEIGCGEGRVSRDLEQRGHEVTAIDIAPTLLRHARSRHPAAHLAVADGAALPFAAGSFDLVVSYNSLQVIEDMAGTVAEAGRVLGTGGTFAISVTHPTADMGHFLSDEPDARFGLREYYFERTWVDDTVERDGLAMRFTGWTHSLEEYALALEQARMHIVTLREPRPAPGNDRYDRHQRVPMFLMVQAVKHP